MGEAQNLRLQWATLAPAVIKVGNGGRGFVLETERGKRIVVTAAHCLRRLPPAHPWSHAGDTYPRLLGPLGKARPTVRAECLFADPLADIAVLGAPDDQDFPDQADAYQQLTSVATPFGVADAPKQGIERVEAPYPGGEFSGSFEVPTPGKGDALVLSLEGEWCKCTVTRRGAWLSIDQKAIVKSGMSGSPIVSPSGKAIGLVSTGDLNPLLVQALPPAFGRPRRQTVKNSRTKYGPRARPWHGGCRPQPIGSGAELHCRSYPRRAPRFTGAATASSVLPMPGKSKPAK